MYKNKSWCNLMRELEYSELAAKRDRKIVFGKLRVIQTRTLAITLLEKDTEIGRGS